MSTPQQITQGDSMPTSLYQLEAAIVELFALRDEAEHEADSQSVAVIDQEIQKWVAAELRKVDGVVSFIRETDVRAHILETEAKRLTRRAQVWRAKGQRVADAALRAMQDHGITKPLHGNSSTLRIQKNGGQEPLELSEGHLLPTEYRLITVTLRETEWSKIAEQISYAVDVKMSADNAGIRAALKQRVTCPECNGHGSYWDTGAAIRCVRCEGSGTIPNSVPGARLVPRGEHLRIG